MRLLLKILEEFYQTVVLMGLYRTKFQNCFHINCDNTELSNKDILDIVTVSLNNETVISYQIKFLKKNLLDPFFYTVIDNSTDPKEEKKILAVCKKFQVGYIKAPRNPFTLVNPSSSHGSTVNWIYEQYIKPRKAKYWGVIDHDIFPVKSTRIIYHLKKQPVYGFLQERKNVWYLWPGFSFFNADRVKGKKMDFMPSHAADTGSRNYKSLYSKLNPGKMNFPEHKYLRVGKGNMPQSDLAEFIGNWVHTFNASGWKNIENKRQKNKLVKDLLDGYLGKRY